MPPSGPVCSPEPGRGGHEGTPDPVGWRVCPGVPAQIDSIRRRVRYGTCSIGKQKGNDTRFELQWVQVPPQRLSSDCEAVSGPYGGDSAPGRPSERSRRVPMRNPQCKQGISASPGCSVSELQMKPIRIARSRKTGVVRSAERSLKLREGHIPDERTG